ncbi:MAG: transporter [Mesorhizobium amorphae]|nr:MAG: transporter [Mesorhizobium amorphae]
MPFGRISFAILLASSTLLAPVLAHAETLPGALAKAYRFNSELNSARAGVRVTDESVPIAKSALRPIVSGIADSAYASQQGSQITTFSFGIAISQTLFDGFQTRNNVRAAEARVFASNETLRNTEQNILFNAASAYMDVIRDRQIAVLTERNLDFLTEQVRASQSRFDVGEGTRTDVAQAEASRAAAVASLAAARAQAQASEATYRQVVGEQAGRLQAAGPVSKLLPKSMNAAMQLGDARHPAIAANKFLVDASGYDVKSLEGTLLPQLSASAELTRDIRNITGTEGGVGDGRTYDNAASIGTRLSIPLYEGGRNTARIRQAKEALGQSRIDVDVRRDQVRQLVTSSWTQYYASIESVQANRRLVEAAQLALNGVVEERNVGQRTTLDVLNAQADVINAQIQVVGSERDVVVASYAIVSAIGALNAEHLGLDVEVHRPLEHYDAVKDKWTGLRTPDGR